MHLCVFQHLEVEHPGVFRQFWRDAGVVWTTIEFDKKQSIPTDLTPFDALVVMGGPMDVWQIEKFDWLVPEMAAIRQFVTILRRPYLGICLGHQLLAEALGGNVGPAAVSEVGPCEVGLTDEGTKSSLLNNLPSSLSTFQWHSAEIKRLPAGATVLASSGQCRVQSVLWGQHAYGLQFHVEASTETVDEWAAIPEYRQSLEAARGPGALPNLKRDVHKLLPSLNATASQINQNFLEIVRSNTFTRTN